MASDLGRKARTIPARLTPAATFADQQVRIDLLERQYRDVVARLERVEHQSGVGLRDEADRHLLHQLIESTAGRSFTASQLWRHQQVDPALRRALLDADLVSIRDLADWLRRNNGVAVGEVVLVRLARTRHGRQWAILRVDRDVTRHAPDPA